MVGQGRTIGTVVHADESAFFAESHLCETRVCNHDALQAQQFFDGQRVHSCLTDGLPPAFGSFFTGTLPFNGKGSS